MKSRGGSFSVRQPGWIAILIGITLTAWWLSPYADLTERDIAEFDNRNSSPSGIQTPSSFKSAGQTAAPGPPEGEQGEQNPPAIHELCSCLPLDNPDTGISVLTPIPEFTAEAFPTDQKTALLMSEHSASDSAETDFFERSIRPILVDHCYTCHGPDVQEAGIRFDNLDTVFSAALSGNVPVIPGDPEKSSLLTRLLSADPHTRMPLNQEPLTETQINVVSDWIRDGAVRPAKLSHWAFRYLEENPPPVPDGIAWCENEIDQYILKELEKHGLQPSPAADRTTLIRRAFLDLIGLPPSPAEVDEFVADERPEAWEKLIERLLASPHFGEKWAIRWLDLARFADSDGYELDAARNMWLYRDWLISALNRDLPFDQFTFEQLAGDLIPNATPDQVVATGFLRNSAIAPDILQHRFEMIVDRVNTVGSVWLGLTLGCAQCHHHKFDPISQKEYYELYAIFNRGVDECSGPRYQGQVLKSVSALNGIAGETLVMADRRKDFLPTHLKLRGAFDADGEAVQPNVPAAFHPPRNKITDRASLACWIIDEANPLTARVTVNRIWETIFGIGIVRTSEDFGLRGERPTHPELLDWLALEFRRQNWSMKSVIRGIMMSAAYRQSAVVSEELYRRDPENRLIARGPRFRVDAEIIRDVALKASGLLSGKLGGPSVFPSQPPGISEKREFGAFQWKQSLDEDQYRRGIYTHWKRTSLYPGFSIFDAPPRMLTCSRRIRSSNPLQALVILNDPVFFEAAVHLGRMMLQEGQMDARKEIVSGFRRCVARFPSEPELRQLHELFLSEIHRFENQPEAAVMQLGGSDVVGRYPSLEKTRWAALTTVANVLLNLDETITKE
ncbi:MAG: PSD1 and planctomycete cytochrome C domain-containing protein [Planctomyces sp.]